MDIEEFRSYCLNKPFVTEEFPFDASTLVFKVAGKMFALTDVDEYDGINLKALPEVAVEMRERFEGVTSGYHMNKVHWNTVKVNSDVPDDLFRQMIDDSYSLVYASLSKKKRNELEMG